MRRIYQAGVVPQGMYGCSAWLTAKDAGLGYTRKTIDTLNELQAKAARTIARAFKATSGQAMDTELFLLPIAQQVWKSNTESAQTLIHVWYTRTRGIPIILEGEAENTS